MENNAITPWRFNGKEFRSDQIGNYAGFVYIITDTTTNRKYIGQKRFHFKKTLPPLKGNKMKRRVVTESDWQTYHGSNEELKRLVADNADPSRFHREILYLCKTISEMNYLETREIFTKDALLSADYFNSYVICRINSSHVKQLFFKELNGSK